MNNNTADVTMFTKQKFAETVDFTHRLEPCSFYDNMAPALERAKAVADLLEIAIGVGIDDFEAETIRYAAQAIRMEIKDSVSMLEAHWRDETSNAPSGDAAAKKAGNMGGE